MVKVVLELIEIDSCGSWGVHDSKTYSEEEIINKKYLELSERKILPEGCEWRFNKITL